MTLPSKPHGACNKRLPQSRFRSLAQQIARQQAPLHHGNHLSAAPPSQADVRRFINRLLRIVLGDYAAPPDGPRDADLCRLDGQLERLLTSVLGSVGAVQNADIRRRFFARLPEVVRRIGTDIRAAHAKDPASLNGVIEIVLCYPGIWATAVYRLAHELHRLDVPLLPRLMTEYAHARTGIDIHPGAIIGESFFIDHGTGVVIGGTARIGNHVTIFQGVTLGARRFEVDADGKLVRGAKRHPTIEDCVTLYANASILGGDTVVGFGAVIGASVTIVKSVPREMTVYRTGQQLGINPARKSTRKSDA